MKYIFSIILFSHCFASAQTCEEMWAKEAFLETVRADVIRQKAFAVKLLEIYREQDAQMHESMDLYSSLQILFKQAGTISGTLEYLNSVLGPNFQNLNGAKDVVLWIELLEGALNELNAGPENSQTESAKGKLKFTLVLLKAIAKLGPSTELTLSDPQELSATISIVAAQITNTITSQSATLARTAELRTLEGIESIRLDNLDIQLCSELSRMHAAIDNRCGRKP